MEKNENGVYDNREKNELAIEYCKEAYMKEKEEFTSYQSKVCGILGVCIALIALVIGQFDYESFDAVLGGHSLPLIILTIIGSVLFVVAFLLFWYGIYFISKCIRREKLIFFSVKSLEDEMEKRKNKPIQSLQEMVIKDYTEVAKQYIDKNEQRVLYYNIGLKIILFSMALMIFFYIGLMVIVNI